MSRVMVVKGDNKTGKSTVCLTAPKKIGYQEFDAGGYNRASHRFPGIEENVVLKRYLEPRDQQRLKLGLVKKKVGLDAQVRGMRELYIKATEDYLAFLDDPEIQTVVWDSGPKFWRIITASVLQEKQEAQIAQFIKSRGESALHEIKLRERLLQIEYSEPNERHRNFIYAARESGKNLIIVVTLRDEYKKQLDSRGDVVDMPTGRKEADGWSWDHMKQEVDLVIDTRVEAKQTKENGRTTNQYTPHAKVTLSGEGLEILDLDLEAPNWSTLDNLISLHRNNNSG
jgi:hypothetical protein